METTSEPSPALTRQRTDVLAADQPRQVARALRVAAVQAQLVDAQVRVCP
jgi:hypothetical protein